MFLFIITHKLIVFLIKWTSLIESVILYFNNLLVDKDNYKYKFKEGLAINNIVTFELSC